MSPRLSSASVAAIDFMIVSTPLGLAPKLQTRLTPTEREVAVLLLAGNDYASIAERRGTALRTIANQVRSVFKKLGVGSRGELLTVALGASEED